MKSVEFRARELSLGVTAFVEQLAAKKKRVALALDATGCDAFLHAANDWDDWDVELAKVRPCQTCAHAEDPTPSRARGVPGALTRFEYPLSIR